MATDQHTASLFEETGDAEIDALTIMAMQLILKISSLHLKGTASSIYQVDNLKMPLSNIEKI